MLSKLVAVRNKVIIESYYSMTTAYSHILECVTTNFRDTQPCKTWQAIFGRPHFRHSDIIQQESPKISCMVKSAIFLMDSPLYI